MKGNVYRRVKGRMIWFGCIWFEVLFFILFSVLFYVSRALMVFMRGYKIRIRKGIDSNIHTSTWALGSGTWIKV